MQQKKILIITRNYPPKTGGLEIFSYHLIRQFRQKTETYTLTLSKGRIHLLWFLPYCLIASMVLIKQHHIRRVHLCDGVLAPLGWILRRLFSVQVTVTVHGLDITYAHPLYQRMIPKLLAGFNTIICVSRATRAECKKRGIPGKKCAVVGNGIDPQEFEPVDALGERIRYLQKLSGLTILPENKILLTVGRLIKRKGVTWFLANVFPQLDGRYIYLIVGSGTEREAIHKLINCLGVEKRVAVLSHLSDRDRNQLYHSADLFLMPNIVVPGDVEGFGITAIEAGACGLPVIASDLQGLRDAVVHGITGLRVPPHEPAGFLSAIETASFDRKTVAEYVHTHFSWESVGKSYFERLMS
ncbi:MAG: hypothetical protein CSA22_02770 [Deltaproteobacteria bacterium]|nr:MAG: hypothetical protein CSA22_02770 [Deltaproteobacteria bacterium]